MNRLLTWSLTIADMMCSWKKKQTEIYRGDETGLRNDCQHERGYALKGKTPTITLNHNEESINMISAITHQGKVRLRMFEGSMNANILIDFMMRLLKDAKQKVFLILDNLNAGNPTLCQTLRLACITCRYWKILIRLELLRHRF